VLLPQIRREIRERGPLPFARFMELALYHPQYGYYARGAQGLGRGGDYVTASDSGRAFGRCVARQLAEIDRRIGPFEPFDVLEFGAGRGLLARDILDEMLELDPHLASRLRYTMVDRSAAMRDVSSRQTPEARVEGPSGIDGGRRGCVLAVELFDALPVQRVRRRAGELVEVFVDVDEREALVEVERPASADVIELATRYGAAAEEGMEAEVAPTLTRQLDLMDSVLERGVMLIVDYGDRAGELYCAARAHGTLLAYHRHQTNQQYLERVGEQDLTAHVNFSALEDRARQRGLTVLGLTTQDRFLIGNGILDAFEQTEPTRLQDPQRARERLRAMQLIHPSGMGRAFKVLLLSKDCPRPPVQSGLRDPFARN
jgi:SAM-dependent MidA family methyltransferase